VRESTKGGGFVPARFAGVPPLFNI
jgi:hypothetical protein